MANIKITKIEVYPIIEEHCQANQLIAEVEAHRTDNNPENLRYYPYDNSETYKYISINETNGKVLLTLEGVKAINQDYSDPSQEITELNFKVLIKDIEIGDSVATDVKVAVVRVHDEPPKIIDQFIYEIFQDDVEEGYRVLDVRTLYNAYFYSKTPYFEFKVKDIGRATITAAGVDYFKNLDIDSLNEKKFTFKFTIVDQINEKTIDAVIDIPLVKGSAAKKIAKKSILEQVGGLLGVDLSYKYEEILSKIDSIKLFNDLFKNIITQDNSIIKDISINKALYSNFSDIQKFNKELINDNLFLQRFDLSKLFEDLKFLNNFNNTINYLSDPLIDNIIPELIGFNYKKIYNVIDNKINNILQKYSSSLNTQLSELGADISDIYLNLSTHIQIEYCNFKSTTVKHLSNHDTILDYITKAISKESYISVKDGDTKTLIDYANSVFNGSENSILVRLDNTETHIDNLQNQADDIDKRKLENWGSDTAWKFTSSGTVGTLQHYNTQVISKNGTSSIVYGNSQFSQTSLVGSTTTLTLSSSGASFGSATVSAGYFDGTAAAAKYSDVAEYYLADRPYDFGTILMFGGENEVTIAKLNELEFFGNIIGVVSHKPGIIINKDLMKNPLGVPVALKGRVKVKIKPGLKIYKGQRIYISEIPGIATVKNLSNKDFCIGYSLRQIEQTVNLGEGFDYIEIFVK